MTGSQGTAVIASVPREGGSPAMHEVLDAEGSWGEGGKGKKMDLNGLDPSSAHHPVYSLVWWSACVPLTRREVL